MLHMYSTHKLCYKEVYQPALLKYGHKVHQSTILSRFYCILVQTSIEHMKHDFLN